MQQSTNPMSTPTSAPHTVLQEMADVARTYGYHIKDISLIYLYDDELFTITVGDTVA